MLAVRLAAFIITVACIPPTLALATSSHAPNSAGDPSFQHGPIIDGHDHQFTPSEIAELSRERASRLGANGATGFRSGAPMADAELEALAQELFRLSEASPGR